MSARQTNDRCRFLVSLLSAGRNFEGPLCGVNDLAAANLCAYDFTCQFLAVAFSCLRFSGSGTSGCACFCMAGSTDFGLVCVGTNLAWRGTDLVIVGLVLIFFH